MSEAIRTCRNLSGLSWVGTLHGVMLTLQLERRREPEHELA